MPYPYYAAAVVNRYVHRPYEWPGLGNWQEERDKVTHSPRCFDVGFAMRMGS